MFSSLNRCSDGKIVFTQKIDRDETFKTRSHVGMFQRFFFSVISYHACATQVIMLVDHKGISQADPQTSAIRPNRSVRTTFVIQRGPVYVRLAVRMYGFQQNGDKSGADLRESGHAF